MCSSATSYNSQQVWRSFNEALPLPVRFQPTPRFEERSFPWRDCLIHVDRFPNDLATARVVLHHGVGTNARMMSIVLGQYLAAQGFDVSALDMPYFGATECSTSSIVYDDWVAIGAHYVDEILPHDSKPLILFGFSAGGMLSYHVACRTRRVSGICGSCFLDMRDADVRRDIAQSPRLNAIVERVGKLASRFVPGLRLPLRSVSNMQALTNDAAMTELLLRDRGSAGVHLPLRFLRSFLDYSPDIEPEAFDRCPIHMFHPGSDRWTPVEASMRFIDRVRAPTHVTMIDGAGHLPINSDAVMQLRQTVVKCVHDRLASDHGGALESAA